jgi:hypothetical protein
MELHEIVAVYAALQIVMAVIMSVFPGDEGMRSKTGIASYTPKPKTAGDYLFNGLVLLLSGGGLLMESVNRRIARKPWAQRVGIRFAIILLAFLLAFVAAVIGFIVTEGE